MLYGLAFNICIFILSKFSFHLNSYFKIQVGGILNYLNFNGNNSQYLYFVLFLPFSCKGKINTFNVLSHLVQNENCLYFLEEAISFVFKEHKAKLNFKWEIRYVIFKGITSGALRKKSIVGWYLRYDHKSVITVSYGLIHTSLIFFLNCIAASSPRQQSCSRDLVSVKLTLFRSIK